MSAQKICLFLLSVAFIAPAAGQIVTLSVQGPYVQAASGMTFPEAINDFRRTSVRQYKPDGSDVSAGYLHGQPNAEIVTTAYSFPSPAVPADAGQSMDQARNKVCGAVAAGIVKSIETANPSARRIQTNLSTLSQNGVVQNGYHALYAMTVPSFMSRQQEAVKSEAFVYCYAGGKWTVEYRFTYPAAVDAGPAIASFMNDLKWTFVTTQ